MSLAHSRPQGRSSIPTETVPISNARLAAELQALALTIHMFGLDGLANMTAERVQKTAESEQVDP